LNFLSQITMAGILFEGFWPNRQNLKYFWIWWKFRSVDEFLKKNNCPYKKLSFCSRLLKITKIHVNWPILVLKVSLWVIEPEKWNFGGCIWWNTEVFRQNEGVQILSRKTGFEKNSKMFFHKSSINTLKLFIYDFLKFWLVLKFSEENMNFKFLLMTPKWNNKTKSHRTKVLKYF
jgi:hypothetical protein